MSRLKLSQKKKGELSQKSRKDIADYISNSKPDRARIRVEHIIREDYYVEAMEMMEMYCDLLLARMGLIQQLNTLDPGLAESVSSILWAGPRMVADVPELKAVCDQLTAKYGKLYVQGVREQSIDTVNAKLMHRLSAEPPPRNLVECYLKEIAAAHGVKYEAQFINDDKDNPGNGGIGELIDMGAPDGIPSLPGFRADLMNPSATPKPTPMAPAFEPPMPVPTIYHRPDEPGPSMPTMPVNPPVFTHPQPGQGPTKQDTPYDPVSSRDDIPPPSYDTATMGRDGVSGVPRPNQFPPDVPQFPDIPDLPDVPRSDNATPQDGANADVDFDELTKRFEELKKRK